MKHHKMSKTSEQNLQAIFYTAAVNDITNNKSEPDHRDKYVNDTRGHLFLSCTYFDCFIFQQFRNTCSTGSQFIVRLLAEPFVSFLI